MNQSQWASPLCSPFPPVNNLHSGLEVTFTDVAT
jgi:hypothetical protein